MIEIESANFCEYLGNFICSVKLFLSIFNENPLSCRPELSVKQPEIRKTRKNINETFSTKNQQCAVDVGFNFFLHFIK